MINPFEYYKMYGEADYYDMNTGETYLIQEWAMAKRFGLPPVVPGIRIVNPDGTCNSYVPDPELENSYSEPTVKEKEIETCSFVKYIEDSHYDTSDVLTCKSGLEFYVKSFDKRNAKLKFTYVPEDAECRDAITDINIKDTYVPFAIIEDIICSNGGIVVRR